MLFALNNQYNHIHMNCNNLGKLQLWQISSERDPCEAYPLFNLLTHIHPPVQCQNKLTQQIFSFIPINHFSLSSEELFPANLIQIITKGSCKTILLQRWNTRWLLTEDPAGDEQKSIHLDLLVLPHAWWWRDKIVACIQFWDWSSIYDFWSLHLCYHWPQASVYSCLVWRWQVFNVIVTFPLNDCAP